MEADPAPALPAKQRRLGTLRVAVVLAVATMAVSACSPRAHLAGGGEGPLLASTVKITPGAVKADFPVIGDATQILRESAADSLEAAGMNCSGTRYPCAVVDLAAHLEAPAAAFAAASPPIRVVELVAGYREAAASHPTATVYYQRTLAVGGQMSTATWMRVSDLLMNDLAADFSFRSRQSGIVIRLPSWATGQTAVVPTSSPRTFHVAPTGDRRADDDNIGSVGNREVRLARRATDYVTEMLTDELRGAGHVIVPNKDGRLVGSELEKFWITSEQGAGGWKTTAEVALALEVAPPAGVKRRKGEHHSCTATESGVRMPGEADLARVLQRCLADLAVSIRNDAAWSL